jgi:hypothetical protein
MNRSDPSNSSVHRSTLKLKTSAQKSPREVAASAGSLQSKLNKKPGAAWSDEYKQRMQEDMDALALR